MKTFLLILIVWMCACSSSKKQNNIEVQKDSTLASNNNISPCLARMIEGFKAEEVQNPPRTIYSYLYKGKTVYYVTPPCCDFFSDLYDSSCILIGHPDGGITGRGDGSIKDFETEKKEEKLIWKDVRK